MEIHLSKLWTKSSSYKSQYIFCVIYTKFPMELMKSQNWRSDNQTSWINRFRVSEVPLYVSFVESLPLLGGLLSKFPLSPTKNV